MIHHLAPLILASALLGQTAAPGGTNPELPGGLPRGANLPGANAPNGAASRSGSILIVGKVLLDDGTVPDEPVIIERVCHGRATPEGYTDGKGRFSFELGRNPALTSDASYGSAAEDAGGSRSHAAGAVRAAERDLVGCELRARLIGYVSEAVNLTGRRILDSPDVGTILLHRRANVEGRTTSATSLNAPKAAKQAYEKSLKLAKARKAAEAQKGFEFAVTSYPRYAAAWYQLGLLHERANRLRQAQAAYAQAMSADPRFIPPFVQIAGLYALESAWTKVHAASSRVIELNPYDYPAAYFYHSVASINLGNLDAAERSARAGLQLDPDDRIPKLSHVLGLVLAQKQDLSAAADSLRRYLKLAPNASDAAQVRQQLVEIELQLARPPRNQRFLFLRAQSH